MQLLCTIQNQMSLLILSLLSCLLTFTLIALFVLIGHTVLSCGLLDFTHLLGLLISKGVSWVPRLLALGLWGFVYPRSFLHSAELAARFFTWS